MRYAPMLAGLALAACGSSTAPPVSVAGNYTLQTIDGAPLPHLCDARRQWVRSLKTGDVTSRPCSAAPGTGSFDGAPYDGDAGTHVLDGSIHPLDASIHALDRSIYARDASP